MQRGPMNGVWAGAEKELTANLNMPCSRPTAHDLWLETAIANGLVTQTTYARGGGNSSGDNFGGEILDTHPILVKGPGNFDIPSPWFLVNNQLCKTLAGANFEQYQLIRDEQKEQSPGWLPMLREACTSLRKGYDEGRILSPHNSPQKAGSAPTCAKKILWVKFRHQTEQRSFPHELVP